MPKEDKNDKRKEYNIALLKLALDKTVSTYGPYKLVPGPIMNHARAKKIALDNTLENFIYKDSVSHELISELGCIPFPLDRGIVGYRVCFVSPNSKDKIATITSVDELKKFKFLQGIGWLDNKILKYHGFTVYQGNNYLGLFGMISKNRADIFPRGANELLYEYENYKKYNNNLTYDTSFALYYPLPRFFFTNKHNKILIERVKKGIMIAYKDGSFLKLWNEFYKESIDFVNLKNRKIFKLTNPFLKDIDKSYEKYIYSVVPKSP
jgi:hypothetical protein